MSAEAIREQHLARQLAHVAATERAESARRTRAARRAAYAEKVHRASYELAAASVHDVVTAEQIGTVDANFRGVGDGAADAITGCCCGPMVAWCVYVPAWLRRGWRRIPITMVVFMATVLAIGAILAYVPSLPAPIYDPRPIYVPGQDVNPGQCPGYFAMDGRMGTPCCEIDAACRDYRKRLAAWQDRSGGPPSTETTILFALVLLLYWLPTLWHVMLMAPHRMTVDYPVED